MLEPTLIVLTVLAFVWIGFEAAVRLFAGRASGLEIACAALSVGTASWVASVWLPALVGQLDRPVMLARSAIALLVAAALCVSRVRQHRTPRVDAQQRLLGRTIARDTLLFYVIPFAPIAAWVGLVSWRSALVPPLSHDALSYHLPRAVFWIRQHGFGPIPEAVDARMRILPANYEMLLADVILLGNGDRFTEWIGVFFYIAFIVACGALAQRWWSGRATAALPVVLLSASVLVLLLHTGADKNDTMTGFFMVAGMVWAGRFFTGREPASLLLCGLMTVAAIGTKPQGLMLAASLFPLVVWRARELRLAALVRVVAIALAAAPLLGGAFYVHKLLRDPSVQVKSAEQTSFVEYDDWANLWQGPWVLLTAPFSPSDDDLYVPGFAREWFWRRDELYFSHLGVPFAICALLAPFALRRYRADAPETSRERAAISLAALATLALMLPVRDVPMPRGIYTTALPRYTLFLVPVVFAATIGPAFARLRASRGGAARVVVYALALWFVHESLYAGLHDRFVPVDYLVKLRRQPESRVVPFDPYRAAVMADEIAGEHDPIAFDAGYAAWIHPAFGRNLARPVTFLDASAGPLVIPAGTKWVLVDRSFALIWQHPEFRHSSDYLRYLVKGKPTPDDTRVLATLMRDPRYELVYYMTDRNQAIFRVRGEGEVPPVPRSSSEIPGEGGAVQPKDAEAVRGTG